MKKSTKTASLLLLTAGMLSSCSTQYLNVTGVAYQSIRSKTPISSRYDIPQDASIILSCQVGPNGEFDVLVQNNTDKIMTIDRTKSFFRNQSGNSVPYIVDQPQISIAPHGQASMSSSSSSSSRSGSSSSSSNGSMCRLSFPQ